MKNRRRFLAQSLGALAGLAGGGMVLKGLAQGNPDNPTVTPATQEAIDAGLAFLERNQHGDGSFGTGQQEGNVAITSICGLAFMAGGHQPGRGRYGRVVTRALEYILSQEDLTHPGFLTNPRASFHGPMYGHGFATLFLSEAHGMVNQPALRTKLHDQLDRSVKLIITTQNSEGGWRYKPMRADADISVTICQIMALRAARNAGFAVPKKNADDCIKYVKDCQDLRGSGGFKYQRQGGTAGFARTAAGVVALYSAGLYEGEEVKKGLDYLLRYKPGNNNNIGGFFGGEYQTHYYYGHYYAAQAMWIAGGRYWREWYPAIRNELLSLRQGDGSWFDNRFCRHYCTGMALIILQIPNNYLPILQR